MSSALRVTCAWCKIEPSLGAGERHVLFLLCLSFLGLPPKEEAEIMERAMTWAVDFTLSFTRVMCIVCGTQLNPPDLQVSGHTQPDWN